MQELYLVKHCNCAWLTGRILAMHNENFVCELGNSDSDHLRKCFAERRHQRPMSHFLLHSLYVVLRQKLKSSSVKCMMSINTQLFYDSSCITLFSWPCHKDIFEVSLVYKLISEMFIYMFLHRYFWLCLLIHKYLNN